MIAEKNAILAKFLGWRYVPSIGIVDNEGNRQIADFDTNLNKLFLVLKEICKKKHRVENNNLSATYKIYENSIQIEWVKPFEFGNFDDNIRAFSVHSQNGITINEIYDVCYQFASWWLALKK